MTSLRELLVEAAARAAEYREEVGERAVFPPGLDLEAVPASLGT